MKDLRDLLRRAETAALRSELSMLGAGLSIGGLMSNVELSGVLHLHATDEAEIRALGSEGFGFFPKVETAEMCACAVEAADGIVAAGLPALFLYVFDEPWLLGERIAGRLSSLIGHRYVLVDDVWAWRVPPGSRGWAPHRGVSRLLQRNQPEILNVWVALSDVTADRACMHVVPLDDDPSYPSSLERIDAPLETVRALPIGAGGALAWNANALHWGGPCSPRARGPRVSCSFTLCRADALASFELREVDLEALDFVARLDSIARQVLVYGEAKAEIDASLLDWARASTALRHLKA